MVFNDVLRNCIGCIPESSHCQGPFRKTLEVGLYEEIHRPSICRFVVPNVHQKLMSGPNPNGPRSVNCDRAISYSGLGVRSVGPVGDFLDNGFVGLEGPAECGQKQ